MSLPVLELEGVTVAAGARARRPLDDVTLTLHRGDVLVVLGEEGAGKSTLAAAVMGIPLSRARVIAGAARFNGRDLFTLARADRRALNGDRIALVSEAVLDPLQTVAVQMRAVLAAHRTLPTGETSERARAALMRAGIAFPDEALAARAGALDPAMRQRVAVALALVHDPELVLVDESMASDATVRMHVAATLVRTLRESAAALLWLTPDPRAAARSADRIAVLYAGRVVEEGRAPDVLHHPAHPYTRALLDAVPAQGAHRARLRPAPGTGAAAAPLAGCAFRERCGNRIQACLAAPAVQLIGGTGARRAVRCHQPLPIAGIAER